MPTQANGSIIKADSEREAQIQKAIDALNSGQFESVKAAATNYEVNYRTLLNRFNCHHQNKYEAQAAHRLLSNSQESAFSQWIALWGDNATAINQRSIAPLVKSISGRKPSRSWLRGFKARHSELQVSRGYGLDPKRARAFNPTIVKHHFELLEAEFKKHNFLWENVYNMDEKGVQLGGGRKGRNQKYFFSRESHRKNHVRLQDGSLQLMTVVECVCADGTILPPGFVLEGKQGFCPEWFEDARSRDYLVSISESGWTNDFLCAEWFRQIFIPHVTARNPQKLPMLLIMDGHGSHLTDEMVALAIKNNIHLYQLPPHTTHKLQPLDVGVFGHVQRKWEDRVDMVLETTGQGISYANAVHHYLQARDEATPAHIVRKSFTSVGLNPINPNIFTEKDYAPSRSTSTKVAVPPSFPTFPSSQALLLPAMDYDGDESAVGTYEADTSELEQPRDAANEENDLPANLELLQSMECTEEQGKRRIGIRARTPAAGLSIKRKRSFHSLEESETHIEQLEAQIKRLKDELRASRAEGDSAHVHCVLARREIEKLQNKVNTSAKKKERRFNPRAMVLTSEEGLRLREEERQKRKEKEEKEKEEKEENERKGKEREAARTAAAATGTFSGALSSKSKPELEDIAAALSLPFNGTKAELTKRIKDYLDNHAALAFNSRFSGLFASSRRRIPLATITNAAGLQQQQQQQHQQQQSDMISLTDADVRPFVYCNTTEVSTYPAFGQPFC